MIYAWITRSVVVLCVNPSNNPMAWAALQCRAAAEENISIARLAFKAATNMIAAISSEGMLNASEDCHELLRSEVWTCNQKTALRIRLKYHVVSCRRISRLAARERVNPSLVGLKRTQTNM